MHDVLGIISTTYSWGFRGADPSTYDGEGVGTCDFVRMQMYRDINVYMEVARRAKLVCADPTLSFIDDTLEEYVKVQSANGRRRLHEVESRAVNCFRWKFHICMNVSSIVLSITWPCAKKSM
jgi:hypothetical protein